MPDYRRARIPGGCYFFTVVTERRQPILTHPDIRLALREAILEVRASQPFRIDGWVLLPDHMHAIWSLPPGDADFSNRWRRIKRHVTHQCGPPTSGPSCSPGGGAPNNAERYGSTASGNTSSATKPTFAGAWIICTPTR